MGIFQTFTHENVRKLGMRVKHNQETSVEVLPSYSEAMANMDMGHEVYSLIPVKSNPSSVHLSQQEVRTLIEAHGTTIREGTLLPGRVGSSVFHSVFSV